MAALSAALLFSLPGHAALHANEGKGNDAQRI